MNKHMLWHSETTILCFLPLLLLITRNQLTLLTNERHLLYGLSSEALHLKLTHKQPKPILTILASKSRSNRLGMYSINRGNLSVILVLGVFEYCLNTFRAGICKRIIWWNKVFLRHLYLFRISHTRKWSEKPAIVCCNGAHFYTFTVLHSVIHVKTTSLLTNHCVKWVWVSDCKITETVWQNSPNSDIGNV